jgi:hypothetical protein
VSAGPVESVLSKPLPFGEVVGMDEEVDGPDFYGPSTSFELRLADPDLLTDEVEINCQVAPPFSSALPEGATSSAALVPDPSGFLGRAVGSVHKKAAFWRAKLEADPYVMSIVEDGYRIPVYPGTEKISYRERNNQSARNEVTFVRTEVARLLEAGLVVCCESAPLCTNPLSVAYKALPGGGFKKRLVIDLSRHVNKLMGD